MAGCQFYSPGGSINLSGGFHSYGMLSPERELCIALLLCAVIDEQEIQLQIQTDAKNVDRLSERAYCRDFSRLGFGSLTAQSRSRTEPFRLTMINSTYSVCPRSAVSQR